MHELSVFISEFRLYDSVTGEFIWEDDGLDHPTTRLILHTCSPPLTPVSLWNQSGMYIVRVSYTISSILTYTLL